MSASCIGFRANTRSHVDVVNVTSSACRGDRPVHQVEVEIFQAQVAQRLVKRLFNLISLMAKMIPCVKMGICQEAV